jgi:transposase
VHKSKEAKPYFEKLNIEPIWNVSYSPEFNPIEAIFSKVKAIFKRQRLNALVRKLRFNTPKKIVDAFDEVRREHCAACVRKSRELLEKGCQ